MDVSFSAKPHTLSLASCPSLSPSKLTSIRRQFLGSSHSLRPTVGLRSRRKSKNLFDVHPPLFQVRASLDLNTILNAVAVVTFSAVSVVYWSNYKRRTNGRKVSQMPNLALSQLGRAINWFVDTDSPGSGDRHDDNFFEEYRVLRKRIEENISSKKEEAVLQFQNSTSVQEDACINKTLPFPGSDIHDSDDSESTLSIKLEIIDPSVPPVVVESAVLKPLIFTESIIGLQLEQTHEEIKLFADLPSVIDGNNYSPSFSVNSTFAEVMEQCYTDNELIRKDKSTSPVYFVGESTREEIYTFYEANANSASQKAYSYTSFTNNSGVYKRTNSALQEADLGAHVSLQTAGGHDKGDRYVARYKANLPRGIKMSEEGTRFTVGNETAQLMPKSNELLHELPHPNGVHANEKRQPIDHLKTYHRLLRDGRLSECVELLEEIDREGFLDMSKVYHARFFDSCKSKRAVEEAFRFTKLIQNRTLSTYNMLMSVCASSQDCEGAFQVVRKVQKSGMKVDCKLYTTLISTCAKCGKVEAMFEVFNGMVNAGVEPNLHTYGALIDGCARAGQVAKAFGVYGIMRSKKVKPDRVIFNALISACGQSGAVDRAFEVLGEMRAEAQPIDPDHVTVGALLRACAHAGQVERAREAYKMLHKYKIQGTPEVYTIALSCCSQTGEWEFARSVYSDMTKKGLLPDEMFLSVLVDVAGHAGKLDDAFVIIQEARNSGLKVGIISYSSLMGACSNAKNWQRGLQLYEDLKSIKLKPTVSTMNALITALCDGGQLQKAVEVLSEMNGLGLSPNKITYAILLVASERNNDLETGLCLFSQAEKDGIDLSPTMSRCIIGMCFRRFGEACKLGEDVMSKEPGRPMLDNKWTSEALKRYRAIITSGVKPSGELLSQVLGCLQIPRDLTLKQRLVENIGVSLDGSNSNLSSLIEGFGEYDPRASSLVEEAASLEVFPCISLKRNPIVVDARKLEIHCAEVYLLTVLKGLKHRLAAGARLPNITILVPVENTKFASLKGEKTITLVGRVGQATAAMLRRLELPYQGNESGGKIRINGLSLRRWFQPKLSSPFSGKPGELSSYFSRLGTGISNQQRNIRTENLSLDSNFL